MYYHTCVHSQIGSLLSKEICQEHTEQMKTACINFNFQVCQIENRADILRLYLNINAGGTPHTKEELDKVRVLLKQAEEKREREIAFATGKTLTP